MELWTNIKKNFYSRFFKNLSMDSLNLSTMKGQCDFYNLELNEEVLMDILEFPVWLNLTKATCNHVVIKIPWTKLKTLPIQFFLDEVFVFVETCENFRTHKNDSPTHSTSAPRKYGYAERLIDGIQITINSVVANFKSYEFLASFQLSHLTVESRTPAFKQCNDLRLTKIKDENRGQILTFKHIEWQALKLEAKSEATTNSTPLRLITGNGRFLLTIKKNLSDCQVVSARIVFIFDDLRWVLTDAMLLSAFHLITYVNNLMNKAPITKKSVEDVSPVRSPMGTTTSFESNSQSQASETPIGRYFSTNDVVETSYHLVMNTLELYVCDDLKPETGRSSYPPLVGGGCLHVIVTQLVIDTYPYHKCLGSRQHWYKSALSNELNFVSQHVYAFADKIKKSKESESRTNIDQVLKGLLSLAMVVRVQKYKIEVVSTNSSSGKGRKLDSKQKRDLLKNEILPDDMPSIYLEVNRFYYYEIGTNKVSALKKAPQPTSYLQVAPFLFLFDPLTLIWVNAFYSNLHKAIVELKSLLPASESDITMHSKIELLMPTFIFDLAEGTEVVCNNTSFHSLEAKCTKITVTNNFNDPLNFGNINNLLEEMAKSSLFSEKDAYPWIADVDAQPISNEFLSLLKKLDTLGSVYLSNLWVVNCDPFWIEFRQQKSKKVDALVDPIQVNAWIFTPDEDPKHKDSKLDNNSIVHIMFSVNSALKVFIDHDKFLFLMRLFEQMDIFNDYLASDTLRITRDELDNSDVTTVSISSVMSDIQVILLLSQEWSKMRSIGTSLCASPPLLTPVKESEFAQNDDISKNSSIGNKFADKVSCSPQSKLISKSESDTLLVANLSVKHNRDEQKLPTLSFHKPLTAAPQMSVTRGNQEYRRTGSYSTLASDTTTDISPFDDDTRSLRSDLSGDSDL
ncbi:UHRF1-binding protein 1-like protein, partial [Leptotrombidium deliense]